MTDLARFLRGAGAAARVEFLRMARHRAALVMTFVMPVATAAIVVFALGSTDDFEPASIGYVHDGSDASADLFIDRVVGTAALDEVVAWEPIPSVADAESQVADEDLGAAIVIGPADGAGLPTLRVVADEDPVAGGVAATIVDRFRVEGAAFMQALAAGTVLPEPGTHVTMTIRSPGGASLDAASHWGPALGAFSVLLALGYAAHRQVEDRRRGLTLRVGSTITNPSSVHTGRALASAAIGSGALLTMAATMQLVFGRSWGSPVHVLVICVATGTAVAGVSSVVASFSKTGGQAQTLTAVVSFGFAILGGSFAPLGAASEPSLLGRFTPTALSIEGFSIAVTTGRTADVLVPVGVLFLTGTAFLLVGARPQKASA